MSNAWSSELNRILIVFIPCTLVGFITGYLPASIIIALVIYGFWTVKQLATLRQWIDDGADVSNLPENSGIVEQHISSIVQLQKSHQLKQSGLQEVINQYEQMITALPDAVVVMSVKGEILSANQAATDLLDIDLARDKHTRITHLIRDPSFTNYFNEGIFYSPTEVRGIPATETELSVRIIPFGDSKLVLIGQDMSQSARIYEMRRSFVSNASHELRTPLTVILGYLETLALQNDMPEACSAAISAAELQANRMKQLVEDLLTLSRLESTSSVAEDHEVVPVASLIMEVVKDAKLSSWFKNHKISTQIETSALLKGNLQEIHSVISNLVNNAVKHTDDGSTITVTWKLGDNNGTRLIVEDDGQGIASEDINRLTERFYRVDAGRSREKGGTGLGLSIVKHIIGRHEGNMQISSQVGKGAIFICSFPEHRSAFNKNTQ